MKSTGSQVAANRWIAEHGAHHLELLFRTILVHSSAAVLLLDKQHQCHEASVGACRLLGLSRDKLIGLSVENVAISGSFAGDIVNGTFQLMSEEATLSRYPCTIIPNVFSDWQLLIPAPDASTEFSGDSADKLRLSAETSPPDYALLLLDHKGQIIAWHGGAERIFGYTSAEAIGQNFSFLGPAEVLATSQNRLDRAAEGGYCGAEGWQAKKHGSLFWANLVTISLRDPLKDLQGFACVVRDFSDRHKREEKLRHKLPIVAQSPSNGFTAGMASGGPYGDFEANDAFLAIVGYTRQDLMHHRLQWPELTPSEFLVMDENAHEEALLFGACAPYEKRMIRKGGALVSVRIVTAILGLSPFRWITLIQDLGALQRDGNIEKESRAARPRNVPEIVGSSYVMRQVLQQVEIVAPTDATVIILGETGTGKELLARAVHRLSARRNLPFITLNCAAIPAGLLESELFGYERGAFTGALSQKLGRFELAHRGTLFLDEIGDIPFELQPKLLRALQEKAFERLGGTKTIPIDVRLIAATNRNLTEMMGHNLFRSDLYYRLNVFPLTTPPLRARPEDIPMLVEHFTRKYAAKMNRSIMRISADTMNALMSWPWPGNVRELESFIERSVILSRGPNLTVPFKELMTAPPSKSGFEYSLKEVERAHILRALRESGWVVSNAAIRLGVPRTTLNALMKGLDISRSMLDRPPNKS